MATRTQPDPQFIGALVRRTFTLLIFWMIPPSAVAAYVVGLALGLDTTSTIKAVAYILPFVVVTGGVIFPWFVLKWLYTNALYHQPGDQPGDRLSRILKLPYKVALFGTQVPYLYGGLSFTSGVCVFFHRPFSLVVLGAAIGVCFGFILSFQISTRVEPWLMPLALEEHRQTPGAHPRHTGLFWPRQNWYLPYVFAGSIISALIVGIAVVLIITTRLRDTQYAELVKQHNMAAAEEVKVFSESLITELGPPLGGGGLILLLIPTFSAWMLARRQSAAAAIVQRAIEGLANGRPEPPNWISTDEVGDLAMGMDAVLENLKEIPLTLTSSATQLLDAGNTLSASNEEQGRSLSQQAAALHEAQVTSQEIRQTSMVAAERAESVLKVAMRAEQLGQLGEDALQQSLAGLNAIRHFVDGIRDKVARLSQSAQQISTITETVKDLADQSNMLALNAAIEAVRSGEHGKGFSVVAREIRMLSDQSIRATTNIQSIIEEISHAVADAVTMTEEGARQVESGFEQVKTSGESLRELSGIVRENSAAVRQISAAVGQQHEGISQIFSAIKDLSKGMDDTMRRLSRTQEAAKTLQDVTSRVEEIAQRYQTIR